MGISSNQPLTQILDVLRRHQVDFILIGGQAEALMGSSRLTEDVDVCYARDDANLERMANALRELGVKLRNVPPDVPFRVDARTLKMGSNFTFDTDVAKFDILGYVEPIGGFGDLKKNAVEFRSPSASFLVIALDDLLRIKQHLGRPKDAESIAQLLAIKRLRQA